MIPSPRDPRFGPTPLPGQFREFRKNQWEAIEEIQDRFASGDDVVFVEAPTGSGKSLIGEVTRRLLNTNGLYVCTTKALQDQFVENFDYGRVIKGKSNYLTELGNVNEFGRPHHKPWSAITCADCTYNMKTETCNWCTFRGLCPYQVAKTQAQAAQLAILNTAFMFTDSQFVGKFKDRGLVILDEADTVEDVLLSQVELVIPPSRMEKLGMTPPRYKTKTESWLTWIKVIAIPNVELSLSNMPKPWEGATAAKQVKEYNATKDLLNRLKNVYVEMQAGNWVYDGYDNHDEFGRGHVIFRPVRVGSWGEKLLWPYGQKFLLMSATILSADLMADELGLYLPYSQVTVESTFPSENRPIYICPIANMSYKNRSAAWPEMVKGVQAVLDRHPDEKVLVHTVSYALAKYLEKELTHNRPIITYTTSRDKVRALGEYKRQKRSVLLAASMDRGIDLPDDQCRVQVVPQIPFPNLKDKRIKARLYSPGGTNWYRMQTIRTLIQMCGRGVRHEKDKAVTYILDGQFTENLWQSEFLFPEWWKEAMIWKLTARHLLNN